MRAAIMDVLSRWPTPSAVLNAQEGELIEAINPLGLQLNRIKALRCMSRDFLEEDWELPSEFFGCGKFVTDSWRIFCRGHRSSSDIDDVNLRRYLQWLNKGEKLEKNKAKRAPKAKQAKKKGNPSGDSLRKKRRIERGERMENGSTSRNNKGVAVYNENMRQTRAVSRLLTS